MTSLIIALIALVSILILIVLVVGLSSDDPQEGTLKRWNKARGDHATAQQLADVYRLCIIEASNAHREAHPLTDDQKDQIRKHLRTGGFLCCSKGKEFLRSIGLDECWVGHINAWFYEYAGCTNSRYAPGGDQHEKMLAKVEKLFSGGYSDFEA